MAATIMGQEPMRSPMRTLIVAGVVTCGSLLGTGASRASAQVFVATPGFAFGVGRPYPVYPYVPVAPVYPTVAYPPVVAPYPVVRPYPYVYAGPVYGPRPFYGRPYGFRRW